MNNCHLFNFYTLYEFRFSDWLICTTWYWVVTKQPHWSHYCGANSTHHCHYTVASADSKFDDLSDVDIDSLIDHAIRKNTKRATAWGISVLKGEAANFKFFIQASWGIFAVCCQQFYQLCAVHSISIIKMLTHSLLVKIGVYLYSFINHEPEIFNTHSPKPRVVLKDLVHR